MKNITKQNRNGNASRFMLQAYKQTTNKKLCTKKVMMKKKVENIKMKRKAPQSKINTLVLTLFFSPTLYGDVLCTLKYVPRYKRQLSTEREVVKPCIK